MPRQTAVVTRYATHPAGQDERDQSPQPQHNGANPRHPSRVPPEAPAPRHNQVAKATITIATLNVNGFTAPSHNMSGIEKWSTIHRTMIDQKIAILALQETHLDHDLLSQVTQCYNKRLYTITSFSPTNPRTSAGVAFVINKRLITPNKIKVFELIEGRALALKITWHDSKETTLLNIYAPISRAAQPEFWGKITTAKRLYRLRNPDFMLGDFNITEDTIDRSPPHLDEPNAITAIRDVRHKWGLHDAWRHAHPNDKVFIYRAISNAQPVKSRLNRIYITHAAARHTFNWQHHAIPVPTDHWLTSVKFAPLDTPYIGKGRWTWNITTLENSNLTRAVVDRGHSLQSDIANVKETLTDRNTTNPQLLWNQFKDDIKTIAKNHNRDSYHKITSRTMRLEKDLRDIAHHPDFDTNVTMRTTEAILAQELEHLTKIRAREKKDKIKAEIALHGEKLGGIWSALNKENKPRDPIYRLRIPNSNPPQFERCSKRMAQLARDYHDTLQLRDQTATQNPEEYNCQLENTLSEIPDDQKLRDPNQTEMDYPITQEQVLRALRLSKNGSATGLDGCPYELWKTLNNHYDTAPENNQNSFNIIKTLTDLFNDIQSHGVDPRTNFAQGWMCPLYKKKDRTEISNYRPITLLNTDYKLLTKVLAIQLMDHIQSLVHENQAGFIPRRSIFNQIRLAQSIITYAEISTTNGAIVALDQEKAYDKIQHDYLWKTLETFQLPRMFINTVKSLYQHATTMVAINGVFSPPFNVQRGVRQGDPLSCALFDLAIKPLACTIRNSPLIQGINIPTMTQNPKIAMFADDTTLFISETDRLDTVHKILDRWCKISGAKFNVEKTEIIPIGSEHYRQSVIDTRKINNLDIEPINDRIHIAADGEAIRSLGAWIGNHTNATAPWEPLLDLVKKDLNRWNRT